MRLSDGVEWALHCCVVLAHADAPVPAARLAEYHGVSQTYLAKQLQALSRAGIVTSTPGQAGGYALTRPADRVTMLDVVLAVDGGEPAFRCAEVRQRGPNAVPARDCVRPCAIARAMWAAEDAYRQGLAAVTVAALIADVEVDADSPGLPRLRDWLADAARPPAGPARGGPTARQRSDPA